jgi:uncharacterized membrane protein
VAAGRPIEGRLAAEVARAGARSRQNTFLGIPVVLTMISSHFPLTTYGQRWSWALLGLYVLIGFAARKLIDRHEAKPLAPGAGVTAAEPPTNGKAQS